MQKRGGYNQSTGSYWIEDKDGNVRKGKGSKEEFDKEYAKYHDRSLVGNFFKNLRFDEILAILQEGEFVLSRKKINNSELGGFCVVKTGCKLQ